MTVALITFSMSVYAPAVTAQAQAHQDDFNHLRTGFPLTGAHTNIQCETCHVNGVFKGTPTNCAGCHTAGRRVVAPSRSANHIMTHAPCETCHTNSVTFLGTRFNHIGVLPKTCVTCHNSVMAPGKSAGHLPTSAQCDACHRTSSWLPTGFDHVGVVPGSCATCHNSVSARGKPLLHIPTNGACDQCHFNYNAFIGPIMNHAIVAGSSCTSCHLTGTNFRGDMQRNRLDHIAPGKPDCSTSGCHAPIGTLGSAYIFWAF